MKKKISILGIVLGLIAAVFAVLLSSSWIFWLAVGVALGIVLGVASARRSHTEPVRQL